jgi:hypothetical protein
MPVIELNLNRVAILLPRLAAEHGVANHETLQVILEGTVASSDDLVNELGNVVSAITFTCRWGVTSGEGK